MAPQLRCRKFMRNSLLSRRQMIVDVIHPGKKVATHEEIRNELASRHNVADSKLIFLFNFRTAFGGGKTTGFCFIYDNLDEAKKFEPNHRLRRIGEERPSKRVGRKMRKTANGKRKRTWGTGRRKTLHDQKRAAREE